MRIKSKHYFEIVPKLIRCWTPSEETKKFIREKASQYHKPWLKEDYVCEEGLANDFGLRKENEMDDATYFWDELRLWFSNILPEPISCLVWSKDYIRHLQQSLRKQKVLRVIKKNSEQIRENIYYLPKLNNMYRALIYAPPIEDGPLYYQKSYIIELKRSKYMAEYVKKFSLDNKLKTLHVLVGLAHESQVEVFLKNPDYPAKLLLANMYPAQG